MASRRGTRGRARLLAAALVAVAAIFGTVTATATAYGYKKALHYHGGSVQNEPHVYLIFWGKVWKTTSLEKSRREEVEQFFRTASGSAWQEVLTQYFDESGPISPNVGFTPYIDESVTTPPKEATGSLIFAEVVAAIKANGWPHGPDDQFMVAVPEGTALGACGYHSSYVDPSLGSLIFSAVQAGCSVVSAASHEYAETVTDPGSPQGTGWRSGSSGDSEIADYCPNGSLPSGLVISKLYDNHLHECVLSDSKPPQVYAGGEEATSVTATSAVLNGVVNPAGKDTTYHFDFGPTTSYGTSLPAEAIDAGSGWKNVTAEMPVGELTPGSTYHFRVVATNSTGTNASEDLEFTTPMDSDSTIPAQLEGMPATEPFDESSASQTEFNTEWSALNWATGSEPKGEIATVYPVGLGGSRHGWVPTEPGPAVNGAYYNSSLTQAGGGLATVATMAGSMFVGNHFSLWLDMPTPTGVRAGYELRVAPSFYDLYNVTLYKWTEGTRTELTSWSTPSFADGDSVALIDRGDAVSGWVDTGSGFSQVLSVRDSTFGGGHAGLEAEAEKGSKNERFFVLDDFKAGTLRQLPAPTTDAATEVKRFSAALNGRVNPEGLDTSYRFEYDTAPYGEGEEAAHGTSVPIPDGSIGSGTSNVAVSQIIGGLEPGTVYHYRIVATNDAGTIYGKDKTLTTHNSPPRVTVEAAMEGQGGVVTLNGRVNPEGLDTSYRFEYDTAPYGEGEEAAHGTSVPIPDESIGSGASNVAVSQELEDLGPETIYHYRLIAENEVGITRSEDAIFETSTGDIGKQLGEVAVTEPFDGSSKSLERFSANWSKLGWASGSSFDAKGVDSANGWCSVNNYSTLHVDGTFYSPSFNDGGELAAVVTLTENVNNANRHFSLWIDIPTPAGTRAGYELRFTDIATNTYRVSLSKWVEGTQQTVLATKASYSFTKGDSLALLDRGGRISAWTDTGSGFNYLLGAADSTFENGKVGLQAAGVNICLANFKVGSLKSPEANSPEAMTKAATSVNATQATLNGTVNPGGSSTSYYFEYGKTTSYGTKVPVPAKSAGSGSSSVAVSEALSGLEAGVTYHFQVVAEGGGVTIPGGDKEFTTLTPPKVTTEAATSIKETSTTINGTVNPEGSATSYHFEYDTAEYKEGEGSHGTSIPVTPESVGSGTSNVAVKQTLTGLKSGTTYHFRVVAEGTSTVPGKDKSFTTSADPRFDLAFGKEGSGNGQLNHANGVAVDASGNTWVVDTANNRVEKFNSKGEYVSQFGSKGTGNGQFNSPNGIAIDSSGNIWVTDTANNRVEKFNSKGEYVSQLGSKGSGEGQFNSPAGIAFASGSVMFVVDSGNNRVEKFNSSLKFVAQFGKEGTGNGEFKSPSGVAIDSAGRVWVVDTGNNRVQKFNPTTYAYISQFGSKGTGNGQFSSPSGIAVDVNGRLWVTDTGNGRVERFDTEGNYLNDQFGTQGTGMGQFQSPLGIAASPQSWDLLVVDSANNRVQRWTMTPDPPTVETEAASEVKATAATLNATVNPNSLATTYRFEYGETTKYGTSVPIPNEALGSGQGGVKASKAISGLSPGTKYNFRVVATNSSGTTYGLNKTFTTLKAPKATTEAASIGEAQATLNGTVNPEGSSTSYYFEYGKTTSYGTKVPASPKSAGSGASNVAVSEALSGLEVGVTYHFQVVAEAAGVTVPGGDREFTMASTAAEIGVLPTLDALNRSETPLSNGGKWSALAWDTSASGHNTGYDTTAGWEAYDASPAVNGAYWSPSSFNDKSGDAAAATMAAAPPIEGRYLALWLDMGSPGSSESGYQLRWILNVGGTTYTVKLSKWSAGKETELASNASVSIPAGTTMAISDTGGTVTAWKTVGGSLTSILSASDSALSEGYAGIEASGIKSRLTNFKAGRLLGGAITEVAVLDDFDREQFPISGKWTQTGWAEEIGDSWGHKWHGYGANGSHLASAYWNPTSFSDAKGPIVVAATLGTGPISKTWSGEYLSLWLDMPNPGSAHSGYEARFTGTNGTESAYKVELSKWVAGERTVLGIKEGFSLPKDTTFALTETGGSLTIWTGTGSLSPVVSATDSAYSSGYVGIEANKGEGTAYDFRAGGM